MCIIVNIWNDTKVKWKPLSCVWLWLSWKVLECTVHGILQARILEWGAFPLFQRIFLTQKSNQGLLHCKLILYQLSYQGNQNDTKQFCLCTPKKKFNSMIEAPTLHYRKTSHTLYYVYETDPFPPLLWSLLDFHISYILITKTAQDVPEK